MMSRKRRNRHNVARKPQTQVITTPAADEKALKGSDGYVNSLAYLGEASPLSQANDYERHSISNDYNLLTVLYRENWLAARIIDTPCEDMTRSWYSISSEIDQEKLDELQKLEAKHSVKQEITNAIRWGRLYGGAAAVMVIKGQEDMLDEPMDYDMLQPGCFRGLIVIDKVRGIFPSLELEEDMDDPEFGYPKWYQVTLNEESGEIIRIHHSRLLLFRGRQLPIDEEINQDYWGASELEHVYEELQKRNSSSANIAQLIFQANVAALKISDYGEVMGMGTEAQKRQVYNYVSEMNRLRTSFGITLMGNEDNYEQHPYSFAGVAEVYETFMMDMAGAAEIPATKLFGRAPQGMNATGESDMKNYYEMINQLQERIVKPALEKLLPVMCMSLWGEIPEDMEIVFEPLGTTTPAERAEIMGQVTSPIIEAYSAGLISQRVALQELRESGKPINAWTNISDADIEKADDEPDQGEGMMDPTGMMGGMPGMGAQEPQEGAVQPEMDMDKVHELKEQIHAMRTGGEVDLDKVRELKNRIRELRGEQPEVDMDKVHELKERIHAMREPEEDGMEEFGDGGDIQVGLEYGDDPQVEGDTRIYKLKERVRNLRENQEALESQDETQARLEKIAELKDRIREIRENAGIEAEDGGPGSGPRPGYHKNGAGAAPEAKKPGLLQRVKFMMNPGAGLKTPKSAPRTNASVAKANKEREDWNNLTLRQKVAGNSAENRHIAKVKAEVAKAAMKGDIGKAREIVKKNAHYWNGDPNDKIQSETLKRQKAVRSGFLHDALSFLREQFDGGPGSGNHGHAGRPGQKGGSAPGGGGGASWKTAVTKPVAPAYQERLERTGDPIDIGPETAYNVEEKKYLKSSEKREVNGPKDSARWAKEYAKQHPEVLEDAKIYKDALKNVMEFREKHPDLNYVTCDAVTGEVVPTEEIPGVCVTFHQNLTEDDPFGGYTAEEYALMCAIAKRELGTKSVYIGVYGNPEISFPCEDMKVASDFARKHNQESIYDPATDDTYFNAEYDPTLNPIKHKKEDA